LDVSFNLPNPSLVVVPGTIVERNGGHDTEEDYHKTNLLIHRLFHIFDIDSSGAVDFSELASGLSVLCGGSRDDKAEAAFALYDYNGDGFISLEEMTRYLASVFKVMFEVQPGTAEQMGVTPDELAAVTANQAFEDADLNHDGRLSFEEFQQWYVTRCLCFAKLWLPSFVSQCVLPNCGCHRLFQSVCAQLCVPIVCCQMRCVCSPPLCILL
jgi:Ca2+-binding EF-hand superfamily protein